MKPKPIAPFVRDVIRQHIGSMIGVYIDHKKRGMSFRPNVSLSHGDARKIMDDAVAQLKGEGYSINNHLYDLGRDRWSFMISLTH